MVVRLCLWQQLAGRLANHLPSTDEFDDSDAAVTTALAFAVEVFKYPFEMLLGSKAAVVYIEDAAEVPQKAEAHAAGEGVQHTGPKSQPEEAVGTQTGSPNGSGGQGGIHDLNRDGESPQCSRTAAPMKGSADRHSSLSSSPAAEVMGCAQISLQMLRELASTGSALYKALKEVCMLLHEHPSESAPYRFSMPVSL